jgi:hypothetical protein
MPGIDEYAVGNADVSGLDPTFARQLGDFIKASPGVSIYSAYRSPQKQAKLWDAALDKYGSPDIARKWVAPPGHSYHGRGQAADLRFAGGDALKWAHDNASQYGLTFPLGNENWHIEPAGARASGGGPVARNDAAASSAGAGGLPLGGVDAQSMLPSEHGDMTSHFPSSPGAAGPRFTADNMTGDAFISDYMAGINPLRTLVMGKLKSVLFG